MAEWNFVIKQGATFRRSLYYTIDNVPVDLTGHTFRMQLRRYPAMDSTLIADWTLGDGLSLDAEAGILRIEIDEAITADYNFDTAYHDLLHTYPDGFTDRDYSGSVSLETGVTEL